MIYFLLGCFLWLFADLWFVVALMRAASRKKPAPQFIPQPVLFWVSFKGTLECSHWQLFNNAPNPRLRVSK